MRVPPLLAPQLTADILRTVILISHDKLNPNLVRLQPREQTALSPRGSWGSGYSFLGALELC